MCCCIYGLVTLTSFNQRQSWREAPLQSVTIAAHTPYKIGWPRSPISFKYLFKTTELFSCGLQLDNMRLILALVQVWFSLCLGLQLNPYRNPNGTISFDIEKDFAIYFGLEEIVLTINNQISLGASDASIVIWVAHYVEVAMYDALAAYEPQTKGIVVTLPKRPPIESENKKNKNIAILHAAYAFSLAIAPRSGIYADAMMIDALGPNGLDRVNETNLNTPEGIGIQAGRMVGQEANTNGLNSKGDFGGRRYNLRPFADTTGYEPVNSLFKINDPTRWQPSITYDKNMVISAEQHFVTPQFARVRTRIVPSVSNFTVPPPGRMYLGHPAYKQTTDEVIEAMAALTDEQKATSEFFNNKVLLVGVPLFTIANKLKYNQLQSLQLFLKVSISQYDALIGVWKEKRRYDAVRPFTAIKYLYGKTPLRAYSKDLKRVVSDMPADEWDSYLPVANHPEYPSATAAVCGSMAAALRAEFGSDDAMGIKWTRNAGEFVFEDGPEKDVTLQWNTWSEFENQCALSRFWSGVHFRDAVEEGKKFGNLFGAHGVNYINSKFEQTSAKNRPAYPTHGVKTYGKTYSPTRSGPRYYSKPRSRVHPTFSHQRPSTGQGSYAMSANRQLSKSTKNPWIPYYSL